MADLAAFLNARLDEDEATARADPAHVAWLIYRDGGNDISIYHATVAARHGDWEPWCAAGRELNAPSTARIVYDPARVLREVAAKRAVLELHHPDQKLENWYWSNRACAECKHPWHRIVPGRPPTEIGPEIGCPTLRRIAAVYDDHPGYRTDWKP